MDRRRLVKGVKAAALLAFLLAVVPMIVSTLALSSSGDRATQSFAVVLVAILAIPAGALIGVGFTPLYAYLSRRGSRNVLWYVLWGPFLVAAAFLFVRLIVGPSGELAPGDVAGLGGVVLGAGAAEGIAFWLGAVWQRGSS